MVLCNDDKYQNMVLNTLHIKKIFKYLFLSQREIDIQEKYTTFTDNSLPSFIWPWLHIVLSSPLNPDQKDAMRSEY